MTTALYTDLSAYYDLMCADIDYSAQSDCIIRLHQIFGNQGGQHLDLACGTGPHIRHLLDKGYKCQGLDINQPMLNIAQQRCKEANFTLGNMSEFSLSGPVDLISCFLYSLHYCDSPEALKNCIECVYHALNPGGMFCFNAVNKHTIDNSKYEVHHTDYENSRFTFRSAWHYSGQGDKQSLLLNIRKSDANGIQNWEDKHAMVAVSFEQIQAFLRPYFDVILFEHNYTTLIPWNKKTGNVIFVCVKK